MAALLSLPSGYKIVKQAIGSLPVAARPHRRRPASLKPVAAATGLGTQLAPAFPEAVQQPAAPSAVTSEATAWDVYTWLFRPSIKAAAYASATYLALDLPLDGHVLGALAGFAFLIYGYDRGVKDAVSSGAGGALLWVGRLAVAASQGCAGTMY